MFGLQDYEPHPQLSAQEVVMIQLDALQNNDLLHDDTGVKIFWRFTSPANRKAIGAMHEFIKLLKWTDYEHFIGFERAELDPMILKKHMARQRARLLHRDGDRAFLFLLSKQMSEPFVNCWMTDSILKAN